MKIVVILPTYNEKENIAKILDKVISVTSSISHHTFEYLVVDDNSPDDTQSTVKEYQKSHPTVHLLTGTKQGLGKALLRGISYAIDELKADIIAQLDADLSHDPAVLPKFIAGIDDGADFAVGSRYIQGGSIPSNWGVHRKIYSVIGNSFVRFGLGYPRLHDWTGGYRAYRKEYFEKIKGSLKKYRGYVFQIAFLHKAVLMGAKVVEIPIHFTDRKFGRSKIAPYEYIKHIFEYVIGERLRLLRQGSFGKFLVVGSIGFVINTAVLELLVSTGFHPAIGAGVGAELAIISNFILNNAWTFSNRKIHGGKKFFKFLQFNLTSVGAILIQVSTVALGSHLFGQDLYRLYYIFGVGIGLFWNYLMYSRVIWKK